VTMMMVMTSTAIVGEDAISFVMIPSTIPLAGLRSSNLLRLLHVLHDLMAVVQFLWHTEIVTRVNDIWWLCFTYAACISIRLMHNILCPQNIREKNSISLSQIMREKTKISLFQKLFLLILIIFSFSTFINKQ
jgi:hypothetical protein